MASADNVVVDNSPLMVEKVGQVRSLDQLLERTTAWRPYPLFITLTMSFLWALCALSAISPAFTAAESSRTFETIQEAFNLTSSGILEPAELTTSVYFLGNLMIGQAFAVVADRYGRRPIIIGALLLTGISGSLAAFSPSFELLLVGRFIQGSCYTPLTTVNYVLSAESIPAGSQSLTSIFFGVFWVLGYCSLAPMSVWCGTWRRLQLATAFPNILMAVFLFVTLPESVAYSIEKKDKKSVEKWIQKNGKIDYNLDAIMEAENENKNEDQKQSIIAMLRKIAGDATIRRRTIRETVIWAATFLIYCALSLTSTSVGDSHPLVSFLFSGIVELPAYLFIPICLKWAPRRPTRTICHWTGAAALLSMYLLPSLHLPVWLLAKFCAACSYLFCFVYSAELFPVFCRSCCFGVCSTLCNVGAILAPHVFRLDVFWPGAQFLVLAALGFLAGLLTFWQPETKV